MRVIIVCKKYKMSRYKARGVNNIRDILFSPFIQIREKKIIFEFFSKNRKQLSTAFIVGSIVPINMHLALTLSSCILST